MALSKISDIYDLDNESLKNEILFVKKELFELRLKKATRQDFKPHNFKHNRRKLSQLLMVKYQRNLKSLLE
jgi:large subunit ribosomal protein L29